MHRDVKPLNIIFAEGERRFKVPPPLRAGLHMRKPPLLICFSLGRLSWRAGRVVAGCRRAVSVCSGRALPLRCLWAALKHTVMGLPA